MVLLFADGSHRVLVDTWGARVRLSVQVAGVLVQHMSQDVLGVLQTLDHFKVGRLHGRVQGVGASLSTLVNIGDNLGLGAEHDLRVVLEVDLHDLIAQAEHDRVPCAHPLLYVDHVLDTALPTLNLIRHLCVRVRLLSAF